MVDMRPERRDEAEQDFRDRMAARPALEAVPTPPRPRTMRTPKRSITYPERQAATVASIAQRVVDRWPKVEQVAAAMHSPTLRAAAPRDGGRGSDHPDPVAGLVLEHADTGEGDRVTYADVTDAVKAWLEQGKWIEQQQIRYLKEHPEAAAQKLDDLKSLCTDPGCDFGAVRRGMCWHHYEKQLAAEKAADQDHHTTATASDTVPDSSHPSALSRAATVKCNRCDWTHTETDTDDEAARFRVSLELSKHTTEAHSVDPCLEGTQTTSSTPNSPGTS